MKTPVLLMLLAVSVLTACAAPSQVPPDPLKMPWDERGVYKPTLIQAEQPVL